MLSPVTCQRTLRSKLQKLRLRCLGYVSQLVSWYDNRWDFLGLQGLHKAFMLKRAAVEPLGHAAAIITDVLENAETNSVINASQKRALLQEMALRP
uniref:Uncharacterized protein n=1 Tax=Cannabis sativa TaxID=3483 RepID=A0A803QDL2_CANSA